MANGAERSASSQSAVRILEHGDIYFAYRPKIEKQIAGSIKDVARLFMILHARGKLPYRLLLMIDKRLPALNGGRDRKSRAFVERVANRPEDVEDELDPKTYLSDTRGEYLPITARASLDSPYAYARKSSLNEVPLLKLAARLTHVPAARPSGEGVYAIARHRGHTHLAYVLELPNEPGEVQRAFNIVKQGNYVFAVKNPEAPSPSSAALSQTSPAKFPENLRDQFKGRRFIPVDPPEFLNYAGAEILLVGARQDIYAELGLKLDPEKETEATAEIFNDLKMERSLHPLRPLFRGKWE
jgi:hypothetical protein